jgi:alpha-ketoglutarate-dependent taurine dioxygenase
VLRGLKAAIGTRTWSVAVKFLTPAVWAKISGVDLARLTHGEFEQIAEVWHQRSALLFRGQRIGDDDLISFSRRFGELDPPPEQERGCLNWPGSNVLDASGERIGALGARAARDDPRTIRHKAPGTWHLAPGTWQYASTPIPGKPSLNLGRRGNFYGAERAASEALLDALSAHVDRPDLRYEHKWRAGDLLLWVKSLHHAPSRSPRSDGAPCHAPGPDQSRASA